MYPQETVHASFGYYSYSVKGGKLIASDGEAMHLYSCPHGSRFFVCTLQGAPNKGTIKPIQEAEARQLFDSLPEQHDSLAWAFARLLARESKYGKQLYRTADRVYFTAEKDAAEFETIDEVTARRLYRQWANKWVEASFDVAFGA